MKKGIFSLLTLLLVLLLPLQTFAATIDDVRYIIDSSYVGEIDGDIYNADSVDEIIDMLDPYSAYFTNEEYESFMNSIDQTTVGIGVVIEKHEKGILILDVIENGSAINYGVEDGDIITAVNGQSVADMTTEQVSSLIKGKEGTSVTVTLLKADGSKNTVTIIRKPFTPANVQTELLYGHVGYIQMSSFTTNGADEVAKAYEELKKEGATSYILDLQNNGGGYVSTAEELIGMFPGASDAYKLIETSGTTLKHAIYQPVQFPMNTRLLVNRLSASASEMTAVALLDQDAAIIYGEKTFGKGTMQGFYRLSDGMLKLTIGEFRGPNNTIVRETGVTPHIQTTSNPIYQAHYDSIKETLVNYKELATLTNVPTTKTFKVKFNHFVGGTVDTDSIELVALGGQTVDITTEVNESEIIVTPNEELINGAEYMLIIHPSIENQDGKQLKAGSYLHITVEAE
nr:S41 family peptidase [Lysinibacillus timonensis]